MKAYARKKKKKKKQRFRVLAITRQFQDLLWRNASLKLTLSRRVAHKNNISVEINIHHTLLNVSGAILDEMYIQMIGGSSSGRPIPRKIISKPVPH